MNYCICVYMMDKHVMSACDYNLHKLTIIFGFWYLFLFLYASLHIQRKQNKANNSKRKMEKKTKKEKNT